MSNVKTLAKLLKEADKELSIARKEFFDAATSLAYQRYYKALKSLNDLEVYVGCSVEDIDKMAITVVESGIEFN